MTTQSGIVQPSSILRPAARADHTSKAPHAKIGLTVAVVGLMVAMAAFIGSLVAAALVAESDERTIMAYRGWTFGVSTAATAIAKVGIALILLGIVRRLWIRMESVKAGLANLVPDVPNKAEINAPRVNTPYGAATYTAKAPKPLLIHRMAYTLWAPMLIMGAMVTVVGLVFSFAQAVEGVLGKTAEFLTYSALSQGTMFFGEALILAGISFILGSILGSLRQGGGEVQESLGVGVKTPIMPLTAKLFVGLMAMGLMLAMFHFATYLYVAALDNESTINIYMTWLGPLRKASLGIMLSGIVLALATIGTRILPFQFWRIQELIRAGR